MLQLKLGWDISPKRNILRLPFHFKMSHNISSSARLLEGMEGGEVICIFNPLSLCRSGQGQGRARGRYGGSVKPRWFGGEVRDVRDVSPCRRNPRGTQ